MIIDSHAHYGHDHVFDEDNYEDELLYWYEKCGIDYAIIQPSIPRPYLDETANIHDEIYEFCQKNKGRFFGMAVIDPHFKPKDYSIELTRCVKELNFVGIKITPIGHSANPSSKSCMKIYKLCSELKIPVMIHTGADTVFANPMNVLTPAASFPDVKFILAHAGSDLMFNTALYAAESCPNIYLEPSWLNIYSLKTAIDRIGPERIMFSTDMPMNAPVEIAKYKNVTDDPEVLEQLFYKTTLEVYRLNI